MYKFLENKYSRWYFEIVNRSSERSFSGYTENHHIIPRSLGGSNKKDNLATLTAREHFICHHLLTKMTVGKDKCKMTYAFKALIQWENDHQDRYKVTPHLYEILKKEMSDTLSKAMTGENNPFYKKSHTDEFKQMKREQRLKQECPRTGKHHSDETKEILRLAAEKQYEDGTLKELLKEKARIQFSDSQNRFNAGNFARGKKWYHNPITNEQMQYHEGTQPIGWIKGRPYKKRKGA